MNPQLLSALADRLGHRLGEGTVRAYQAGIHRASAELGMLPEEVVRRALSDDRVAREALLAWVTVQETYLFRNPEHFELAAQHARAAAEAGRPVRAAWSVGCASGEEAYSLAHALLPHAPGVRVVGTDVSARALAHAQRGRYGAWSFRQLRPEALGWQQEGELWAVPARLRAQVSFQELNLASRTVVPPLELGGPPDVIFCRNVLLYFAPGPAAALLRALVDALAEGGLLVMGALEVPPVLPAGLRRLDQADGCAFLKGGGSGLRPTGAQRGAEAGVAASPRVRRPEAGRAAPDTLAEARRLAAQGHLRQALSRLGPAEEPAAWDLAASLCIELGETLQAQRHLERLVAAQPQHLGAHLRLALLAARSSDAAAQARACAALEGLIAGRSADEQIDGELRVGYVRAVLSELSVRLQETGT